MIGYKAFKKDKNGIYTDGMGNNKKIYWKKGDRKKIEGELELCKNGFHFFKHLCFAINYLEINNEIHKVIIHGNIIEDTFKCCTNDIELKEKITKKELNKIIKNNHNSGNHNSGNRNSGDYNSGNRNSGNRNSGYCNSGYGYLNYFCTKRKYFLFDIEIKEIPSKIKHLDMSWFDLNNKTYKEAWRKCPINIINILKSIPEFNIKENKIKFKEITGLDLDKK